MRKIISLFERDWEGDRSRVLNKVTPGAEWVIDGEGVATRKWDGTCCKFEGGKLYKRYDAKHGKTPPVGFIPAQPEPDPNTGHWPGWLEVLDRPEDKWFNRALVENEVTPHDFEPGTYELCGPKIGGNHERWPHHVFLKHGDSQMPLFPRTFEGIRDCFRSNEGQPDASIEGVVWHHPDGRMVKIKASDFGCKR